MIPTRIHGFFDYLMGLALIVVPYMVSDTRGIEMWLPMGVGVLVLLQSLITDYECSVANLLPVRGHLAMDATVGGLLAISPWLLNFDERVFWPHVIVGVGLLASAVMTEKVRRDRRTDVLPTTDAPRSTPAAT